MRKCVTSSISFQPEVLEWLKAHASLAGQSVSYVVESAVKQLREREELSHPIPRAVRQTPPPIQDEEVFASAPIPLPDMGCLSDDEEIDF
jgi:hypothetical protein